MLFKNALVFTEACRFEPLSVVTGNGRISALLPAHCVPDHSGETVDCEGCLLLPGLTDIHLHGAEGHDFCEGTAEATDNIARFEFSQGVTSFCPATMTLPDSEITRILAGAASYKHSAMLKDRAELVGIHLEGPFISPKKCGAQAPEHILPPSAETLCRWQEVSEGLIKLVTIAPETEGAIECISRCSGKLRFSLGHTECSFDTALKAFAAGADHITHTFNAMPPFMHRETGLIGAAFDTEGVFAELICDGIHVSPTAVRAVFKLFGDDRVVLVSDSMEATGMPDGEYQLGGQQVNVKGDRAELSDGTLAGSVTTLYGCLRKAVDMGIPLESALKAATINPCRSVGIDDSYGSIAIGKKADLLLADKEDLSIRGVYRG